MKDEALALVAETPDPAQKINVLREYLQALTLRSLHESEAFVNLAFIGGTALRFVYSLPRFSEDLDFSLEQAAGYQPREWLTKIKTDLTLAGFNVRISWNDRTAVNKAWIRISQLLQEAGLAGVPQQNISIKLEIDTRPPAGPKIRKTIVNHYRLLALQCYDLPSLMAGKLHALLTRGYPKGRDWYDLLWYRGQRPPVEPNLELLQNALDQTQGAGKFKAGEWKKMVEKRAKELNERELVADAAPFLERPEEANLLKLEHLLAVLL